MNDNANIEALRAEFEAWFRDRYQQPESARFDWSAPSVHDMFFG